MILNIILVLVCISYVTALRPSFFDSVYFFDFFILLYVFTSLVKRPYVNIKIVRFIIALYAIIFPSMILALLSNDVISSVQFLVQYLFTFAILPLFCFCLSSNGSVLYFLRAFSVVLVVNSILYIVCVSYLGLSLYFPTEEWPGRLSLGDFTPNELGHYLILLLFSLEFINSSKTKALLMTLSLPAYIFTHSKTILVKMATYFLYRKTLICSLLFCLFFMYVYFSANELFLAIFRDFSSDNSSNSTRIDMFVSGLENLHHTIFSPAFYSLNNTSGEYSVSVHNFIISFIVNFGLISFFILIAAMIMFVSRNGRKSSFKLCFPYIVIDSITFMLNPMLSARITWFPMMFFIVIIILFESKREIK